MHQKEFIQYLELEKRYSKHTLIAYKKDLEQFINFLSETNSGLTAKDITFQSIRSWIASLNKLGTTERSINRKISTLKSYFKFLKQRKLIENNPILKIKTLKQPQRIVKDIPEDDLERLFSQVLFEDNIIGVRDKLIIELFYLTGIRKAELIDIKISDVNFNGNTINVLGKGNKERLVLFTDSFRFALEEYLIQKEESGFKNISYLFVTKKGEKLYPKLVYTIVNKYLSIVSSRDKKSPHVLRHSFATHMLNKGADLNTIKELLGHANLNATQIYTHASIEKLKLVYNQTHPRGHNKD